MKPRTTRIAVLVAVVAILSPTLAGSVGAQETSGSISGTVVDASGEALAGICVEAHTDWYWSGRAFTDGSGAYTISDLGPESYRVRFYDCRPEPTYVAEWYDDRPDFESADPVEVGRGEQVEDVDAELVVGGEITGTVTDEQGDGLARACVLVERVEESGLLEFGDSSSQSGFYGGAPRGYTSETGAYRVPALRGGDYRVRFYDCNSPRRYLGEWYDDRPDRGSADLVTVTEGEETGGIDAALTLGGAVSGRMTDTEGDPVRGICAEVYSEEMHVIGEGWTSDDGTYFVGALPEGAYLINFSDCYRWEPRYRSEWFVDAGDPAFADPVSVARGVELDGVDAVLVPPLDAGVTDLVVENRPLRTDWGGASGVGWERSVDVEVSNLGPHAATDVRLIVRACPETSRCEVLGDEWIDVPAESAVDRSYEWNGFGTVGDVKVEAIIENRDDPVESNDREVVHHYVLVGGTGFGVGF